MNLRDKWITGLIHSFSIVDSTLIQQGFKRCGTEEQITYQLKIKDSATRSDYFLKIPATIQSIVPGKNLARLGTPSLKSNKSHSMIEIPPSIRQAVEDKLAEVADYLTSHKR